MRVLKSKVLSAARDQIGKARYLRLRHLILHGAFLHDLARPCSSLVTKLNKSSLRIAIALRLVALVCSPHTCVCGESVDRTGIAGLGCHKSAGRLISQSVVNDLIIRALLLAEIQSKLEPNSLLPQNEPLGKTASSLLLLSQKSNLSVFLLVVSVLCVDVFGT